MDGDDIEARLEAVERALADGDADLTAVTEAAEHERELDELRARVADLETQLTDLAASVQAVRGYVGNVRTVNRDVERRADAALAKVEELERHRTDQFTRGPDESPGVSTQSEHGRPRSGGEDDDSPESPGDIARRITGREGDRQEPRHSGDSRRRDSARRGGEETARRRQPRSRSDTAAGSSAPDDEDGLLSGLRDAL